ncbi:MAG: NADH-quinone oxidoreductase subunit NuoN [Pseudomonadota bacterium]|nr:NADH-quinone oxidoreductase subunit NuoN [Pseudomonadota bacterium]
MTVSLPLFIPALPEVYLALVAMALLMLGALRGSRVADSLHVAALAGFPGAAILMAVAVQTGGAQQVGMYGMFILDPFALVLKGLILTGAVLALLMGLRSTRDSDMGQSEYPVLVILAVTGMMVMVSANDLMSMYLGLELQGLSLYILAAFQRDRARSGEAGLKYFVLGALSSGLMLYGMSLLYGFAGSTSFDLLAQTLVSHNGNLPFGVVVGMVLVLAGMAFKVSAAPFHMWAPDVYQGAPTPVTAFFALAPKVAALGLLARILWGPFAGMDSQAQQVLVFLSAASMIVGAFGAIRQDNIKRLLAYSSIGHAGYALIGLAAGSSEGVRGLLFYMVVYMLTSAGAFGVVLAMRRHGEPVEKLSDLAGLARTHMPLALAMLVFMFSMAGIPPAAGFFAKFFIFQAAVEAGGSQPLLLGLAILGVLSSVVAAFYYLNIVRIMWLEEPVASLDKVEGASLRLVIAGTALLTFPAFLALVNPVMDLAAWAAGSITG